MNSVASRSTAGNIANPVEGGVAPLHSTMVGFREGTEELALPKTEGIKCRSIVEISDPTKEQIRQSTPSRSISFSFDVPHTITCDDLSLQSEHSEENAGDKKNTSSLSDSDEDWLPDTEDSPNSSEYLSESDHSILVESIHPCDVQVREWGSGLQRAQKVWQEMHNRD